MPTALDFLFRLAPAPLRPLAALPGPASVLFNPVQAFVEGFTTGRPAKPFDPTYGQTGTFYWNAPHPSLVPVGSRANGTNISGRRYIGRGAGTSLTGPGFASPAEYAAAAQRGLWTPPPASVPRPRPVVSRGAITRESTFRTDIPPRLLVQRPKISPPPRLTQAEQEKRLLADITSRLARGG